MASGAEQVWHFVVLLKESVCQRRSCRRACKADYLYAFTCIFMPLRWGTEREQT